MARAVGSAATLVRRPLLATSELRDTFQLRCNQIETAIPYRELNGLLAVDVQTGKGPALRSCETGYRRCECDRRMLGRVCIVSAAPSGYLLGGRFDLVEVIGEGGTSTVYRAVDRIGLWAREQSPEVAVKLIQPHAKMRQKLVQLLHREARLLRDCVHRNLVRIYDSDYDGTYHYLVMEFLKGRSLAQILADRQGRPLSPSVSFHMVCAAGQGLAHMHSLGIVHGDLKPGNIFMTSTGEVKILDFGTVLKPGVSPQRDRAAALLDEIGLLTPTYASPEMLMGEPRAESDDVYSLAVVAYLALTGTHPYARWPADEALKANLTPEAPPTISPAQWRVLASGLALNRRHRIKTVGELVQRLARPRWFYRWRGRRMPLL
ncbi:serine/threonine-protein kinase [Bradyrhizobium genosp. P]|uniref:serine/threonine-protein kinase n=1 Tax=Bradyrhizobium genosp. P TaxID=83641 RepID=UPI003CF6567B